MLKWLMREKPNENLSDLYDSITEGIQSCYKEKMLPLEKVSQFHTCYTPMLTDADFAAKPMVCLFLDSQQNALMTCGIHPS